MKLLAALAIGTLAVSSLPASACEEHHPLTIEQLTKSEIVVRGTVTAFEKIADRRGDYGRITLDVTEALRGNPAKTITIYLASNAFGIGYSEDSERDIVIAAYKPRQSKVIPDIIAQFQEDRGYVALSSVCSAPAVLMLDDPRVKGLRAILAE